MQQPERRRPLRARRNIDNVNRQPVVLEEEEQNVVEEQVQPNPLQNCKVDKVVGFVEQNVYPRRYCSFLICEGFAEYKCKLLVSGKVRHYCYACFEHFRTDVVVCEADSTGTEA